MRIDDQFLLGLANLWRMKLRMILTTLGVAIGIGALVSMVSFGIGMQKNVTDAIRENDLFTSLTVTGQEIDIQSAMQGNIEGVIESFQAEAPLLNRDALEKIQSLDGVEIAFPEIVFPVKVRMGNEETQTTLRALPASMGQFKPFNEIPYGHFFASDSASLVLLNPSVLKELKRVVKDPENPVALSWEDSARGVRSVSADSILGKEIEIITSVIDVSKIMQNPLNYLNTTTGRPFREAVTPFRIGGLLKEPSEFSDSRFISGVIAPIGRAEEIPQLGFTSVRDLFDPSGDTEGYGAFYVRVRRTQDLDRIQEKIEEMGYNTFSIMEQLDEIKKGFIILDTALGTIGIIALFVAALGIINTMVMSILERTREIGIMKAIGGSENEIKGIFFFEAGAIGLIGGIFGLILGWIVTRIANVVANYIVTQQGGPVVDYFYMPIWLLLGAIGFSIFVSLLAGLYPAMRAARVDPVEALRHD
ncbi:ABC transporter permease [bacterium]|nr:ABC transporter permease [bacterium]